MDNSEQILKQLRWIKWLTAALAVSFALIAATVAWMSMEMRSSMQQTRAANTFVDRARALLDADKLAEVLALCDEREKVAPKDAYIPWYRGNAYYREGKWAQALQELRQAEEMSPHWRQDYTGPLIRRIEQQLSSKKKKP